MTEKELMMTTLLGCDRTTLYAERFTLTEGQNKILNEMGERRRLGEPLQYILKECEFMGLTFCCDERALVPRPETEILVDTLIKRIGTDPDLVNRDHLRILDLGTGSGNIAVCLAQFVPDCTVTAVDISESALALAGENAQIHRLEDKINFEHCCLLNFFERAFDGKPLFDIIVSNPPYIARPFIAGLPRDVQREPRVALEGGEDGFLYLNSIIEKSKSSLARGGLLCLEIGDKQRQHVENLIHFHYQNSAVSFIKDYRKTDRVVIVKYSL